MQTLTQSPRYTAVDKMDVMFFCLSHLLSNCLCKQSFFVTDIKFKQFPPCVNV